MGKSTIEIIDLNNQKVLDFSVGEAEEKTYVLVAKQPTVEHATVSVHLVGKGAKATIVGVLLLDSNQQFSLHTVQHHDAPETKSNLLIKGVLSGSAVLKYDGVIRVEKHAQKTDAYQRNENLLMDPDTYAVSEPALEILANDVRCTHGAIVKTIDEGELWYLSSRGIPKDQGKELIKTGFIAHALFQIPDTMVRQAVSKQLGIES